MRPITSNLAHATVLAALLLHPRPTTARSTTTRPSTDTAPALNRRVVHVFDFNERPLGNLESIPMHWEKVTAPGFPHYVNGAFDDDNGNPKPSFKLQLNGGNVAYRFFELKIPAFSASDHTILADVKTRGLQNARGYLEAFYMDRFGDVIKETRRYSRLIGPRGPDDPPWRRVRIELPFTHPAGRFVGLGIFLVQQDHLPEKLATPGKTYRKDITAAMSVDNIIVLRLPCCRLNLLNNKVIYNSTEPIVTEGLVADPVPDDLTAKLTVRDLTDGTEQSFPYPVCRLPRFLDDNVRQPTPHGLTIGPLKSGPHEITLQVLANNLVITSRRHLVAVLPPPESRKPRGPDGQFGVDLADVRDIDPTQAVDLLTHLGAAWAIVPIWRADLPADGHSLGDRLAVQLNRAALSVLGAYIEAPKQLAEKTDLLKPSIWDLFALKPHVWTPALSQVLSHHADRIDHWVFGRATSFPQTADGRIAQTLSDLRKPVRRFQDAASLLVAWPVGVVPPQALAVDGYVMRLPDRPPGVPHPDHLDGWNAENRKNLWLVLPKARTDGHDLSDTMVDVVKQFLHAKRAGVEHVGVTAPWTASRDDSMLHPTAEFPVYANLIRRLDGLKYAGQIQLTDHVGASLFTGPDHATLVIINNRRRTLTSSVTLGEKLSACDMWGRPVPMTINDASWEVAHRPVIFVEGIDPKLAAFIASVTFDPPALASRFGAHRLSLTFTNVFSETLSGQVRLYGGRQWDFNPPGARFAVTPDNNFVLPVTLQYPRNEPIGQKAIVAQFHLESRRPTALKLIVPVELTSPDLTMRVWWSLQDERLVVWQEVRNAGTDGVDLEAFLIAPQRARMVRHIRRLMPSRTVVKEYTLDGAHTLIGEALRVGLREVRGDRVVNQIIRIN